MIDPRTYPLQRHLAALLWIAPALAAVWAMPAEAPYAHMLFDGGDEVFLHNQCILILIPYVALFVLALGALLLPDPPDHADSRLTPPDFTVVQFFGGAGLLAILGVALGAANLLFAWITIPIFAIVLYLHLLKSPAPLGRFFAWIGAADLRRDWKMFPVGLLCRISVCLLVLLIIAEKAIVINLNQYDAVQLYFPYVAEVRRLHGIWLDPARAIIFSFFVGRGHGAPLFFASFTDQFFIQVVSIVFFMAIALVARRVVSVIVPGNAGSAPWAAARAVFPDCAMLFALSSPLLQVDSGKFHFETGAFLMFLSWASLLFVFADDRQAKWLGWMLLPAVLALPIAIPQTQAVVTLILAFAAAVSYWTGKKQFVRIPVLLILAGCVVTALSLLVNQLYIGLAEINPYQLFVNFMDLERFRRWSSPELLIYVSNAQGFQYLNDIPTLLESFLASFRKLAEAGHIDILRAEFSVTTVAVVILALLASLAFVLRGRSRRERGTGSARLLDESVDAFVVAFFAMYMLASLLVSLSGHGSLQRLMSYLDAYAAIFCLTAFVLCGAAHGRLVRGTGLGAGGEAAPLPSGGAWAALSRIGPRCGIAAIRVICLATLVFTTFNVRTKDVGAYERADTTANAVRYVMGAKDLISVSDGGPWPQPAARRYGFCATIGKIIPPGKKVLPLNSGFTVVPACSNSPLLPWGEVQDTLHYAFARQFGEVVLGAPAHSYAILRAHDVDYFLVEKPNAYFWGPGVSENFSPENLAANFDVFYEDADLYIFTWRGKGVRPVTGKIADAIRKLHEVERKAAPQYYEGLRALRDSVGNAANSQKTVR
ncbi:MAG: hypothetical protein WA373_14950 [Burkholderiales bacterium]